MEIDKAITVIESLSGDLAFVARCEADGRRVFHWANAAFSTAIGYTGQELIGQDIHILHGQTPDDDAKSWLSDAFASGQRFRGTLPYHRKNGTQFWGDLTLSPWSETPGMPAFWLAMIRDISPDMELRDAFRDAKKEAVLAQQRLWSAIEAMPDAFVLFDPQDRIVMSNARYRDQFDPSAQILKPGATFEDILRGEVFDGQFPEAQSNEETWIKDRLKHFAAPEGPLELELKGNRFERIHEVRAPSGDTVSLRVDITEIKRQQRALERRTRALSIAVDRAHLVAYSDVLTGLSNRRGLDKYLNEISDGADVPNEIAYIVIDLDRFKQINDTLGHAAGDHVLREVAAILRNAVRAGDHVARLGGDEFAIITRSDKATDAALRIAQEVIEACAKPVWFEGKICYYGASVGISVACVDAGIVRDTMMIEADYALYQAKEQGRGMAVVYAPAKDTPENPSALVNALREGIGKEQIVPLFAPQVEIATRAVVGFAVTPGWRHPNLGLLPAERFMSMAHKIGAASMIEDLVFDQALAEALSLSEMGYFIPRLAFSVDAARLESVNLADRLIAHPALPFQIAMELDNTVPFDAEPDLANWAIDGMREAGAEIEFDRFGTGTSSLTALMRHSPSRVKIAVVPNNLDAGVEDTAGPIPLLIARTAAQTGAGLTATNVASMEEADAMQALGCDVMQGEFVSAPLPLSELTAWVMASGAARVPSRA